MRFPSIKLSLSNWFNELNLKPACQCIKLVIVSEKASTTSSLTELVWVSDLKMRVPRFIPHQSLGWWLILLTKLTNLKD